MILSGTGWTSVVTGAFEQAGQLAASASALFSKKTKVERELQKAERENQQQAIAKIQLEKEKQVTRKVYAAFDWQRAKTFVLKWWWVAFIVLFFVFLKPILRFFNLQKSSPAKKKSPGGKKSPAKGKKKGQSLIIHGKHFSSISAKMKYLRSLRKK